MEAIRQMYFCISFCRQVPLRVIVDRVSGIGDDSDELVEVQRSRMLATRCPKINRWPLIADE